MEFHWNIHIRNSFIIKPLFPCIEIPIIKTRPWCIYNIMIRRISQIPRCKHISHNAPFCNRNVHTCTFLVFLIQNCALWDMGMVCCWICATRLIVRRHMKRHQMDDFPRYWPFVYIWTRNFCFLFFSSCIGIHIFVFDHRWNWILVFAFYWHLAYLKIFFKYSSHLPFPIWFKLADE